MNFSQHTNQIVAASVLCLAFVCGCGGQGDPGFGSVEGKVTIDSEPAPEGTRIRFHHQEDNESFLAIVKLDGAYRYDPPPNAPLRTGDYRISIQPITTTTTTDESGMSISQPISGAPKSYGKYSDPKNSGLEVTLSSGAEQYDIAIESK